MWLVAVIALPAPIRRKRGDMTHPEVDTRARFLEPRTPFYFLGEWHVAKQIQPHLDGKQLYVRTESGRTFLTLADQLVATEPKLATGEIQGGSDVG